jgi:hypothetical protein
MSLLADPSDRLPAEAAIKEASRNPGFTPAMLDLCTDENVQPDVQLAASI